jgi:L-ribulose-5-phosphate 3-epimerase
MLPHIGFLQGRLTPTFPPEFPIQFFPSENWRNEFLDGKRIGFDHIELLVQESAYGLNPLWNERGTDEINRISAETGLGIRSVHGFYSLSKEYPEILRHLIAQCGKVSASVILLSFFNEKKLESIAERDRAYDSIAQALDLCESNGISLGLEAELPADVLLEFIGRFPGTHIGVYYDIGNQYSIGMDVPKEIRLLGNRIVGVHVKDRRSISDGGASVPLGEGCADFGAAFKALFDIDYARLFIIQGARAKGTDDLKLNADYLKTVKTLLQTTG